MPEIPSKGLCQDLVPEIEDILHVRHFEIARIGEIFEICSHVTAVEYVSVQKNKNLYALFFSIKL